MMPFFFIFTFTAISTLAAQAHPANNSFCVVNRDNHPALFAVDVDGIYRAVKMLSPEDILCTPEFDEPKNGFVSVFTDENAIEGCSRLAPAVSVQVLLKYQDFDNCAWQINP